MKGTFYEHCRIFIRHNKKNSQVFIAAILSATVSRWPVNPSISREEERRKPENSISVRKSGPSAKSLLFVLELSVPLVAA